MSNWTIDFAPMLPAGVLAVILDALSHTTLVAATPPMRTVAPCAKLPPASVTDVPPVVGPDAGVINDSVGAPVVVVVVV